MRTEASGTSLVVATFVFAGCLGATHPAVSTSPLPSLYPAIDDPLIEAPGHDHRAGDQHHFAKNMTLVGFNSLTTEEGQQPDSHALSVWSHYAAVAVAGNVGTGIDIVDLTDPKHPTIVGAYRDANAIGGDRNVAWSADGNYVFMGNEGGNTGKDTSGVRIINVKDKTKPAFESFTSILPAGVHTIFASRVGTTQYVYALNYGVQIYRLDFTAGPANLVLVGRYITASAAQLMAVNKDGPDDVGTRRDVYGHDMAVYSDAGKVLMYVAYAYEGLEIVDITNPVNPQAVAHWVPSGPGAPHYVHSVRTYTNSEHRRITIVGSETFEDRNTNLASPVWILDTTDLATPRLLATWTNPGHHGADHLLFSAHFFDLDGDTLYLSHYHGGLWALNLTRPDTPRTVGYFLPSEDTGYAPANVQSGAFKEGGIPMTLDVVAYQHYAVAADISTGLYVVALG